MNVNTKVALLAAYEEVLTEARTEFEASLQEIGAQYQQELNRKKEEDEYQFGISKRNREDELQREIQDRKEALYARENAISAREVAANANESLIADLKQQVEGIDAALSDSFTKGFSQGASQANKDAETEVRVAKAEYDAELKVLKNNIQSLENVNSANAQIISTLRQELADANKRVESVAKEAFTAAGQSKVNIQNSPSQGR